MNMKDHLNILLVHNHYRIFGGEDSVFDNEAKMLEKHGHRVYRYERSNTEIDDMNFREKARLFFEVKWSQRTFDEITKIIHDNSIDLVHVHNPILLITPSVFDACIQAGVPVVQTLHNFRLVCLNGVLYRDGHICEDCIDRGIENALKNHCYRGSRLQTLALARSAEYNRTRGIYHDVNFICTTAFNKEKILTINREEEILDPDKVFIKPNFVPDIRERKTPAESGYYLYAGRLEEIKGVRILVEAFNRMPERKLVVIGDGDLMQDLRSTAKENIVFHGRRDREEVYGWMTNARALVYPTQVYEGARPLAIGEAYACGCPVIASNKGNAADLVDEGTTGTVFDSSSADALIQAVERFECMDSDWKVNTRKYYEENLEEEENYRQLMDIYRGIMKNAAE